MDGEDGGGKGVADVQEEEPSNGGGPAAKERGNQWKAYSSSSKASLYCKANIISVLQF